MKGKENSIIGADHVNWLCRRLMREKGPLVAHHDYVIPTISNLSNATHILKKLNRAAYINLETPIKREDGSVHFTLLPRGAEAAQIYQSRILLKML